MIDELRKELLNNHDPAKAKDYAWFFKTGYGEYGEGQKFLGVSMPVIKKLAKKYTSLNLDSIQELLLSEFHAHRSIALEILKLQYQKADTYGKEKIANLYLKNAKNINNWDLVDTSALHILGDYLLQKDRAILYKLAKSSNLWEKRISIISTFAFIRQDQFQDTLDIAEILLHDKHDLIHKAVGWMLREVGKRDVAMEERFLKKHCTTMPRTMLRYATEKFDERKRLNYLNKKIKD